MKLYIGNPTTQDRDVACRPAEYPRNVSMRVPAGRQVMFGDFTDAQVQSIKDQLCVYGLATVDEAMRARRPTHYLYSVDRQISAAHLLKVFENNKELTRDEGARKRKSMAIRAGQEIDNKLAEQGDAPTRALELSLEEEKRGETREGGSISEDKPVAEGFRFVKQGDQPPPPSGRNRPRRAA